MIKKLQKKFILIAMISSTFVIFAIFGLIIIENYLEINNQIDGILNIISKNDGKIPEYEPKNDEIVNFMTQETQFSTRYFVIRLNASNSIIDANMDYIASVTKEDISEIVENVLQENKDSAFFGNYKYLITEENNEKIIVFLDCTTEINNLKNITEKSIIIIVIGLFIVFIVLSLLSKKILSPIIKNIEKQKQFITNAGHELKTPVAVILANTEVMELTCNEEEKEWIKSTKNQARRLDVLIKSLLNLANVDEGKVKLNYSTFSITDVIRDEISEFKALLKEKDVVFDSQKQIDITADLTTIKQLVTILLDNSIKYTPDGGKIEIKLEKNGKNIKMEFLNSCENPDAINTDKLFDRFYRDDKSRNKSKEGYGIGLSIAQSIVENHNGKIYASITKEKLICFTIII